MIHGIETKRLRIVISVKLETKKIQKFSIRENLPFTSKGIVSPAIIIDKIGRHLHLGFRKTQHFSFILSMSLSFSADMASFRFMVRATF